MIKNIPFLIIFVFALASCESSSVEDQIFTEENENLNEEEIEIIDIHEDRSHGLGN